MSFFGNAVSSLLGSTAKGSVTGQRVEQAKALSPGQEGLLNSLVSFLQPQIGQPGRVPPTGLGPLGPSQLQQQAFDFAGGLPQTLQGPAFGQFESSQFDPSQFASQVTDPIGQFARRGFREETIPAIMGALGSQGAARSSGAADILGREGRNLELGLASQFAPLQFGAQQAHLGRQFAGQQAQLGRQAALPGIAGQLGGQLANLGAVQRGVGAERQQFDLNRFLAQDPAENPALSLLGLGLGTPAFTNVGFQGFFEPSILSQLAGAGGAFAGAGGFG